MSESQSEQADPQAATSPGSVFGNLPDSRPGGRSPRRDSAAKSGKPRSTKSTAKPKQKATATKTKATSKPATSKPRPTAPPPEPAAVEPESGGGGLEDIAWAGVAAAAEAATLGIRLANRAFEALRGNSEKS